LTTASAAAKVAAKIDPITNEEFDMKKIKSLLCVSVASLALAGCASHADNVQANYVSPLQYQDYSCHQIREELVRLSHKVNEISGLQDKRAGNDEVAMGVGLVLFWPALFFLPGNDHHVELAELKGDYDALQEAAIQKNCDVAKEMKAAEEEAANRKAAEQQTQKKDANQTNN
jgi:hypothetical protein